MKSSEPSDEVPLPLPLLWPLPPAEEVEFEGPEPVALPGMVWFEAGETEPADEACTDSQYVILCLFFSRRPARGMILTEDVPLLLEMGAPSRGT